MANTLGQSAGISRLVNTTFAEIVREELDNTMRRRRILAALKEKGRITGGHGGDEWKGPVRVKRVALQAVAEMPDLTFTRSDRYRNWVLPWRGYAAVDMMTKREEWMNKTNAAVIQYTKRMAKDLMADAKDQLPEQCYQDGNAAGNTLKWHGLNSSTGVSGASATAPIGTNSDEYATLSTTVNALGGSWSGNWPNGSGDPEYDAWTPLVVDYESAVAAGGTTNGWSASTKTWPNTCVEAIRYGIAHGQRGMSELDFIILTRTMWLDFINNQETKERIQTERNASNSLLIKLGFGSTINFDGVDITWEYGIPETEGFGLVFDEMELAHLGPELLTAMPVNYQANSTATEFSVLNAGNLWHNPRALVKWDDVT